MSRARKVWVGISVFLLVVAVVGAAFHRSILLAYHKYGLRAAKAESVRLRTQGPGRFDEFKALFRGKPWTSRDCISAAEHHAQCLVRLGFLRQAEYPIAATEFSAKDDFMRRLEEMNRTCPWWTYSVPKGGTSVVVIACPRGMADWQKKTQGLATCAEPCCTKENQFAARVTPLPDGF